MVNNILNIIKKIVPNKWHWAFEHEGYKRYFVNTGWMFGGQIFSLLISFFIGAWLARYLGPENYGVLSYTVAFVGLFGFIASLGVDGILNRELIKFPERRDELLGTAFRLKLIGGTVAFLLTVVVAIMVESNPLIKLLVIIFSFDFILQAINVIGNYFKAEVKAKSNVVASLFAATISSILKIAVILLGRGVIWIIMIYVFDSIWYGIGLIKAYNLHGLKIKNWHFSNKLARSLLRNSWPLMLASVAGFIYIKIDQVMIGSMMGNRDVGIYAAAVKLVEIWYFIPGIICGSLFPAIVNAKKTNVEVYRQRLKNLYILMAVISIGMAIPITLLAKPIIQILFGNGYLESVNILRIYIWSSIGMFLAYAVGQYLMAENLVKTIFWLNFCAMAVNIVLNLIFIPMFGLIGSAWATFVSYLVIPVGAIIVKKINHE